MNEASTLDLVVPENIAGKASLYQRQYKAGSTALAIVAFKQASSRLLDADHWYETAGEKGSVFSLVKANEGAPSRIEQGDFIKADLPGAGPENGGGYDWLRTIKLLSAYDKNSDDSFALLLQPSYNPFHGPTTETAHFLKKEASIAFTIKRTNKIVSVCCYGRNQLPNLHVRKFSDKVRNAFAYFITMSGIPLPHWSLLIKGLLKQPAIS